MSRDSERVPLSAVQATHWFPDGDQMRLGVRAHAGALRVTGDLPVARLVAAIDEVVESTDVLRVGFDSDTGVPTMVTEYIRPEIRHSRPGSDAEAIQFLRSDRDTVIDPVAGPLVRIHVMICGSDEFVIAAIADPLVLDLRSTYLLLGAVLQAALGRYRPDPTLNVRELWATVEQRQAALTPARQAWWARRLDEWGGEPADAVIATSRPVRTDRLDLADPAATGQAGAAPEWSEVVAALAWSTQMRTGTRAVLTGGLDLREVLDLPSVMGPLTDRLVFAVDLSGLDEPSPGDLVLRARAGMLDAVVHHVPYRDLITLGATLDLAVPPQPGRADHVVVHHCRLPPSSRHTRGDPGLARLGLSIELFAQAELVAASVATSAIEIHLAESGSELALILDHDPAVVSQTAANDLLADISRFLPARSGQTRSEGQP